MSTKTLRKRIALATVTALGAGVLSLVSTSVAHAASSALTLQTTNATDGVTYDATHSVGYLGSGTGTGTSQTATVLAGGAISVLIDTPTTTSNYASALKVTGGTIVKLYNGTATATAAGTTGNTWATTTTTTGGSFSATIVPNTGVTSFTIQSFDSATASSTGPTSGGTLAGQVVVTVAAASVAGVPSAANSSIYYDNVGQSGGAAARTSDYTTKVYSNYYMGNVPWSKVQNAQIHLADAYGNNVTNSSATSLLTATATNGALVGLSHNGTVSAPALVGSAFSTSTAANGSWELGVAAPSAAPLSTTVTISYDGKVIGTKSFVFTGPVAKVSIAAPALIGVTGKSTTSNKGAAISLFDSAGNALAPIASDAAYPTANFAADSANPANSGVAYSSAVTDGTAAWMDWTCASVVAAHTDSVKLKYTNVDGTVVTSNAVNISCAGGPDTYKATLDKASYNSGDVAVLTVQFLDSKGNKAADMGTTGTLNTPFSGYTTTNPQITAAGGTLAANVSTADNTALGAASYRILTGTTSGTFQQVVNVTAGDPGTDGTAQTVALVIGSSGTSLNDVLKGIVSLIASINKQIAALAKLVAKKK